MNNCLNCIYSQATRLEPYIWEVECLVGDTDLERPYCDMWTSAENSETSEVSENN